MDATTQRRLIDNYGTTAGAVLAALEGELPRTLFDRLVRLADAIDEHGRETERAEQDEFHALVDRHFNDARILRAVVIEHIDGGGCRGVDADGVLRCDQEPTEEEVPS